MGPRQSRTRNASCRTEPVEQGLARQGEESLRSVMPREDESEKMSVGRKEVTSPTLLNPCQSCASMSKRREVGLGSGGENGGEGEGEGGGEDASLVKERQQQSRLTVSWQDGPFAFI